MKIIYILIDIQTTKIKDDVFFIIQVKVKMFVFGIIENVCIFIIFK